MYMYIVREKKLAVWNKANADLYRRKEFFIGRKTKKNLCTGTFRSILFQSSEIMSTRTF